MAMGEVGGDWDGEEASLSLISVLGCGWGGAFVFASGGGAEDVAMAFKSDTSDMASATPARSKTRIIFTRLSSCRA